MPELPEVEVLCRGLTPLLVGSRLMDAQFFRRDLREPIPVERFKQLLTGEIITHVRRRSKLLLVETLKGVGIFHLGMSGNMLVYPSYEHRHKHTHAVFQFNRGTDCFFVHYIDPRRFGIIAASTHKGLHEFKYLKTLGVEPLEQDDLGVFLWNASRGRNVPVKTFLMNARIVVGVGNIYANEALFRSGISPLRPASAVSKKDYQSLGEQIKETLCEAIEVGGTTFRDYLNTTGEPGYFRIKLKVYGRKGQACTSCAQQIQLVRLQNRATYFCDKCQK